MVFAVSGQTTVPYVFVHGVFVGGCDDGPKEGMGTLALLRSGALRSMVDLLPSPKPTSQGRKVGGPKEQQQLARWPPASALIPSDRLVQGAELPEFVDIVCPDCGEARHLEVCLVPRPKPLPLYHTKAVAV